MELMPGYKRTEVGVIPDVWDCLRAREFGVFKGGSGFPLWAQGQRTGEYPFFKVSDMNNEGNGTFMTAANHYISEQTRKHLGAHVFPADSIVFAKVGAAVFLERKKILGQPSCIDNNMAAYVLNSSRADVRYVHSLLLTKKLGALVATTALPALNGRQLGEMVLALPPLPEQRAIAQVLSDVDALLATLDQMIAKKRDLKQAAKQQLLTGETRLPGFRGDWEVAQLGNIGHFLKGRGVKKDEAQSGMLPCIRYGEIYTHHNDYIKSFNSWVSPQVATMATRLKQGDLLFAGSGETKGEIGKCVAFIDDYEAYAGGDTVILRATGVNPMFMGYYCNTVPIAAQKTSKGQGDAVVHISAAALSSIVLALPSLPEQNAIAAVLSNMDAELLVLEARRDKIRNIKQGMMQELLTGKTRLVQGGLND
ncbi:restriction endonuclease subunit S [Rhodocyclus tenuis]|uniref:Type I restriction enzyme S subunit n=1 Tax=Rhodocyclus tenuis TaxID=1066 RepID=A0A840G337_RHOTE|nr:restriction endonuclease subunit S [Rhodocyclus tenuis]MBB4248774.1 type I restriction enzyme S subunit [Rhodocyclus tenuis]